MNFYTSVTEHKSKLLVSGYENGVRFYKKVNYKPYLFVPTQKESKWRTIRGQPVDKMSFDSIFEAKTFVRTYEEVENFKVYGMSRFQYPYIHDNFRGCKADKNLLKLCILDIEVSTRGGNPDIEAANKPITAITCQYPNQDAAFTFGLGDYDIRDRKNLFYVKCKDEKEILLRLIKLWSEVYRPDVVTGWNIEFFDIPYIVHRITTVLDEKFAKRLSPFGLFEEREVLSRGRMQTVFVPIGINILDYYQLYKKFTYTQQESYKLDHIAMIELGEQKVVWKDEYASLDDLSDRNYQLFIDYNLHDCELVKRLNDKMKLLELVYDFAYDAGVNYADAMSAVRSSDVIIHNYLIDQCVVVPHVKKGREATEFPVGAFVKDPQAGLFKWVMSVDLTSLYPHLIIGYNISPDTFVKHISAPSVDDLLIGAADKIEKNGHSFAANGTVYRRDKQGFLGALMEQMFEQRKHYKKKMQEFQKLKEVEHTNKYDNEIAMYHNLQQAKKIQLNSFYGALANPYFRWYDLKYAEAITVSGQLTIRWAEQETNKFINEFLKTEGVDYVIAVDTDSLYLKMEEIANHSGLTDTQDIHDYLEKFATEKLQPFFDQMYQRLADYMNAYKQACHMKLEVVADRGIFVTKKRYILNVLSSEGIKYDKPKLKIMGIEAVRSSTPQFCRDSIKEALRIIMTKTVDDLRTYIDEVRATFEGEPFQSVAFPRGVQGIEKYSDTATIFKKGTPMHVRASLMYNFLLKSKNVGANYPEIYSGDKIKFCYLMTPNPIHSNIIACHDDLPKEFELDKYIDYDTQFEKAFIDPIQTILDAIGWRISKVSTLERFYE